MSASLRLASFATVIAFDRTGIGLSDPMRDNPTVEDWAAQLESVLDAAGFHSSFVLGHAWGGLASVTLAATHPERGWCSPWRPAGPERRMASRSTRCSRPRDRRASPRHSICSLLSPTRAGDVACSATGGRAPAGGASPAVAAAAGLPGVRRCHRPDPKVHVPTLVIDRPDAPRSWASDTLRCRYRRGSGHRGGWRRPLAVAAGQRGGRSRDRGLLRVSAVLRRSTGSCSP